MEGRCVACEAIARSVGLEDQIRCVAREIAIRREVYRTWVAKKRMLHRTAERELGGMVAVLESLKALRDERAERDRADRAAAA